MLKKVTSKLIILISILFLFTPLFLTAQEEAVNVILKNNSAQTVEVELKDQYGGNYTATIEAGTSQNQTLQSDSEIIVNGNYVHIIAKEDEGKEIIVAGE